MAGLTRTNLVKHAIKLIAYLPFKEKIRTVPYAKKVEFKAILMDALANNMIMKSVCINGVYFVHPINK